MRRRRTDHDDDERVLRDGETLRVPLTMLDSLQRDIAQHFGRVRDALGNEGLSLQRPGFRVLDRLSNDECERAYQDVANAMTTAWKGNDKPKPVRQDATEDARQMEYDRYSTELRDAWRTPR